MASPKHYWLVASFVLVLLLRVSTTTHAFLAPSPWKRKRATTTTVFTPRLPSATSMVRNPFQKNTSIQTKETSPSSVPPSPSQKTPVSAFQSFWEDLASSTTTKQKQDETPKAAAALERKKESKTTTTTFASNNPFQDMMMNFWSKAVVTSNSPPPQEEEVPDLPPTEQPAVNFWDSFLSSSSSSTIATTTLEEASTIPSSSSSSSSTKKEDSKFDFVQRIESVKCAIVGALAGSLAMAPYAFVHYLGNVPQWEFQTDLAALQGALFAIVYRYAIRGDTNPMLNQGVLGAFVLVRTLPTIQASSSQCTAIPLSCGPPTGYLNWDMIGQGFSQGIESALLFGGACAAMDYAFEKGWISKFE